MTSRQYIFLIATGAIFFFIALADLLIHNPNTTYGWFGVLHGYGKLSVICFAIILVVLMISPFIGKKRK